MVGETLPPDTLPANPLLQAYVDMVPLPAAALAASVVLCPLQIVPDVAVGADVGIALTLTATVPVTVHELELVTVTV